MDRLGETRAALPIMQAFRHVSKSVLLARLAATYHLAKQGLEVFALSLGYLVGRALAHGSLALQDENK